MLRGKRKIIFLSSFPLVAALASVLVAACAMVPSYDAGEFRSNAQTLQADADRSYQKVMADLQMKTALYNRLAQTGTEPAQKALPRLKRDLENLKILQPTLEVQNQDVARKAAELQARTKDRARIATSDSDWSAIRDLQDKMERSADALEVTLKSYLDISKSFNETVTRHGLYQPQASDGSKD